MGHDMEGMGRPEGYGREGGGITRNGSQHQWTVCIVGVTGVVLSCTTNC
jgi:hypothetical protein